MPPFRARLFSASLKVIVAYDDGSHGAKSRGSFCEVEFAMCQEAPNVPCGQVHLIAYIEGLQVHPVIPTLAARMDRWRSNVGGEEARQALAT